MSAASAAAGVEDSKSDGISCMFVPGGAWRRVPLSIALSYLSIKDIFTVCATSKAFLLSARQAVNVVISNKLDAVSIGNTAASALPANAIVRTRTGIGHGGGHGVHVIGADFTGVPSFCVTDEYVARVLHALPVARLILPMVPRLTDTGVLNSVKILGENLKVLSLEGNIKLASDNLCKTLGTSAPELVELNLSGCLKTTAQGLAFIISNCRELEVLKVGSLAKTVVNAAFLKLLKGTKIRALAVPNCAITNVELEIIVDSLGMQLQDLDISYCETITSDGIKLLTHCPELLRLRLYSIPEFNDKCLEHLVKLLKLRSVDLSMCTKITDEGLKSLIKRPDRKERGSILTYLNLCGCKNISDQTLHKIEKYCETLESISLYGNDAITEKQVLSMVLECKHLKYINLGSCKNLSATFVERITSYRN
eukprot:TRINITY_DN5314_c0_g1_i2.p1 TRINITY_DN5314_c0_g1~~TRINITY_DN5314_c0_g1_i2.p1  ORF type:complete len:424 (+),score=94.44 TRINITY_DN5314_c0_g1_i2:267-1538(+)